MTQANKAVMLLTHLIETSPEYARWAFELQQHYKILDNSLIELGGAVTLDRVLRAANTVAANEIILPDVFLDGPGTVRAIREAIDTLHTIDTANEYALMAVCQGKDAKEFMETFGQLEAIPEISVIGIPKVCAKLHPAGRPYFEGLWAYSPKKIHLLGVWYSWEELNRYAYPKRIRSVDSCLAAFQTKYRLPASAVRPDKLSISLEDTEVNDLELLQQIGAIGNEYGRSDSTKYA